MTGVLPVPAQPDAACSTCLEPLTDDVVRMVKCGHMFHCTCILPWFQSRAQRRGSCPNCRADFEPEPLRVPHTPIRHAPLPYTPVPLTPAPYTPVPHTPTSYRHLSRTLLPYARSPNTHIHFGYRLDSGDIGREAPVPPHSILPRQRMIEIRERVQISREHDIIQREIAQSERMRGPQPAGLHHILRLPEYFRETLAPWSNERLESRLRANIPENLRTIYEGELAIRREEAMREASPLRTPIFGEGAARED